MGPLSFPQKPGRSLIAFSMSFSVLTHVESLERLSHVWARERASLYRICAVILHPRGFSIFLTFL